MPDGRKRRASKYEKRRNIIRFAAFKDRIKFGYRAQRAERHRRLVRDTSQLSRAGFDSWIAASWYQLSLQAD
jgi:hypothetical protein